jgi:hypothetical protein
MAAAAIACPSPPHAGAGDRGAVDEPSTGPRRHVRFPPGSGHRVSRTWGPAGRRSKMPPRKGAERSCGPDLPGNDSTAVLSRLLRASSAGGPGRASRTPSTRADRRGSDTRSRSRSGAKHRQSVAAAGWGWCDLVQEGAWQAQLHPDMNGPAGKGHGVGAEAFVGEAVHRQHSVGHRAGERRGGRSTQACRTRVVNAGSAADHISPLIEEFFN